MRFLWVIVAEGIGRDAKGALTAIGLNQDVLIARTLPAITKRAVIGHLAYPGLRSGDELNVGFSVIGPDGKQISAHHASIKVDGPAFGLPETLDVSAEFLIPISEYGTHRLAVEVRSPNGEMIESGVDLHVVRHPEHPPGS